MAFVWIIDLAAKSARSSPGTNKLLYSLAFKVSTGRVFSIYVSAAWSFCDRFILFTVDLVSACAGSARPCARLYAQTVSNAGGAKSATTIAPAGNVIAAGAARNGQGPVNDAV